MALSASLSNIFVNRHLKINSHWPKKCYCTGYGVKFPSWETPWLCPSKSKGVKTLIRVSHTKLVWVQNRNDRNVPRISDPILGWETEGLETYSCSWHFGQFHKKPLVKFLSIHISCHHYYNDKPKEFSIIYFFLHLHSADFTEQNCQRFWLLLLINVGGTLLEMIALSPVQSFPRILIHKAILFINTFTIFGTTKVIGLLVAIFDVDC